MEQGNSKVYLDNAATTYPKPEAVYREVERFMREVGGSAGRSGHRRSVESGRAVYSTRSALAALFGVRDPLRIAFTKNATEALNTAIRGLLKPGDHVITTSIEHNSVMRPLTSAAGMGIEHTVVECDPDGRLDPARLAAGVRRGTALIVVNHASNVTGTMLPVADIAAIARDRAIPLMVDAAQTAGRIDINVEADGIDLLAFTGHKELFGLQGTGGIYVREGIDLVPLTQGGTGSESSSLEQPHRMPDMLESGTLNAPGIVGLGAGVEFVAGKGVAAIRARELDLMDMLLDGLTDLKGVKTYGPSSPAERVGIVAMTFEKLTPPEAAEILDQRYGIATRAGLHCSPLAHRTIGTIDTGALRVSLSCMNTEADVGYLLECLSEMLPA